MIINVDEVMELLRVPRSTAYALMRELNKELNEQGYRTIKGKVQKEYLLKRYGFGGDYEQ